MVDFSKPWACGECGQMTMSDVKHTFEDCEKWKASMRKQRDTLAKEGVK